MERELGARPAAARGFRHLRRIAVSSVYVPNGRAPDYPYYRYKLDWLAALRATVAAGDPASTVVCGDLNIAPTDDDVYDPAAYATSTHVTPAGMFHQDLGMRIDPVLAGADVTPRARAAWVDRQARKGTAPSDHAPVIVDLDEAPDGDCGPAERRFSGPRPSCTPAFPPICCSSCRRWRGRA